MELKNILTVACIAALGSSAGIAHSQEQDDSRGIGLVTSEPSENTTVDPVRIEEMLIDSYSNSINTTVDPVKIGEIAIDNYSNSIIDASLQEELNQLKGKNTIEVVIYLDTMIDDEENDFESSGSASYFTDTNELSNAEIKTNDPELDYAIEGINFEDQLVLVEERRAQQSDKHAIRRIEKSQKTVQQLLKKLRKKRFNRLISFDESEGIITAALRKKEIKKLSRFPEYILSITQNHKAEPALSGAFNDVRLNTTSWPVSTYGGQGVGIYMREAGNYCFEKSNVQPIEWTIGLGGGNYTEDRPTADSTSGRFYKHPERVAQALRAASPRAHIYCSDEEYSLPRVWSNNIHVVNYSWVNRDSENTQAWDSESEKNDNFSYHNNVQVFSGSGNSCRSPSSCAVASPAKSHNAMSVGAYNHRTNQMGDFSSWKNPSTGARKPEIVAPGVRLNFAANQGTAVSGTSLSTPLAAGMAASNISVMPGMKKQPALIKASMLAMATKTGISNNGNSRLDGARGIRWNPDGHYSWWDRPHTFLDDANGQWKLLKTYNLRSGESARIALSWLNRAEVCNGSLEGHSYTPPKSRLCLGLAMKVVDPIDREVVYQNVKNQNWQAADFYTNYAGNYKVYVWRTRHHYEWSGNTYYYNRAKLGLRIAYIDNW